MKTLLNPGCRQELLTRLRAIPTGTPAHWGVMSASEMLTHLIDSLRHMLGEIQAAPRGGPLRWPVIKPLMMYWLPWPRGRVKGSPELFRTLPSSWNEDLATFTSLLDRFAADTGFTWPAHPGLDWEG